MNRIATLLIAGIALTVTWQNGGFARTQIQYATTPTSTWKTLAIAPAGDNSYYSPKDNNSISRGRYYYFRARHILDNGTMTPWSKTVGAVWLTGGLPGEGTKLIGKDNSTIWIP